MASRFIRIRSWHIIRSDIGLGAYKTYCGRLAVGRVKEGLPDDGKTCEACFRIRESQQA